MSVVLKKIATPEQSTATALRRRVLELLAAQNGHGDKKAAAK